MAQVRVPAVIAAAGAVALTCAAVSGCTINIGTHTPQSSTPKVSKEDLQKDISGRLGNAGATAQSVNCPEDLIGEVGKTTRCEVTMTATNSFEPIVTVTSVAGSKVNYDIAPAVSKTQLEAAVSQQVATASQRPVDSVSCESGLAGTVGAVAHCAVTTAGATTQRTVKVSSVTGLSMSYGVVPMLPKDVVAKSLLFQLAQEGQHPDSATCADNLDGSPGNTVECTTITAGQSRTYILTVTTVQGSNITYKYAPTT